MLKRLILAAILIGAGVSAANAQDAESETPQARPLITEDVEIIRPGTIRLQAGIGFQQDQDFSISGLNGDITKVGEIGIRIGLSPNVEMQIDGTVQQFLSINGSFRDSIVPLELGAKSSDSQDVGDFTISTKIKVRNESKRLPALGLRFGFELPNTDQARGIGQNSTNVFADILIAKTVAGVRLFGSVGIGILESPAQTFAQNDVLRYGVAFRYPVTPRFRVVGEVNGRHSTRSAPIGTEDRAEARVGVQFDAGGLKWDAAGTFGLTRWSPQTGLVFGVTYDIKDGFDPVLK
jgi:hypothetical protein